MVTPSEMEKAIEMGLEVVKFFPAEPSGGLEMIKAVAAPYTMLKFMPTGGINPKNIVPYLQYEKNSSMWRKLDGKRESYIRRSF